MTKKKWLALALAIILVVSLMGGVVSARNNSPAAPAVANKILKEAGIRGAGQIMRHVAQAIAGGAAFPAYDSQGRWDGSSYVDKSDAGAYRDAVAGYLKYLGTGVDSTETKKPVKPEKPEEPVKPFSPKDIDDLFLWLDASALDLKNRDTVDTWEDQSGNENHAVATDGMEPSYLINQLNGKPVVYFDGESELIIPIKPGEDDFADGVTVFLVANFFDAGFALGSWDKPYLYMGIWQDNDEDYWIDTGFGDNWSFSEDPVALQGWRILEMINDEEETVVYDNGEEVSAYSSSFAGTNQNQLAIGNANGSDYNINGDIAEILIYNRALNNEEREDIEGYLIDKYFE